MTSFANEDLGLMSGEHISDDLQDLFQSLFERLIAIIDTRLTERQKQIVKMLYLEQKTQTEVARILGLCQPSVHKSLHGNLDYRGGRSRYGGAQKKIKRLCSEDPEIQRILKEIDDIRKNNE